MCKGRIYLPYHLPKTKTNRNPLPSNTGIHSIPAEQSNPLWLVTAFQPSPSCLQDPSKVPTSGREESRGHGALLPGNLTSQSQSSWHSTSLSSARPVTGNHYLLRHSTFRAAEIESFSSSRVKICHCCEKSRAKDVALFRSLENFLLTAIQPALYSCKA